MDVCVESESVGYTPATEAMLEGIALAEEAEESDRGSTEHACEGARRENRDGLPRSAARLPQSYCCPRAIRALRRFCRTRAPHPRNLHARGGNRRVGRLLPRLRRHRTPVSRLSRDAGAIADGSF